MSSLSRIDDVFASLPLAAKIWIFLWTYLAASGWFSTYMLLSSIGDTRRNGMIDTLMPDYAFVWTVAVMFLSSFVVIGLLFYGRYTRKKKDVVKAALKKYEETNEYIEPKIRFDLAIVAFWIGGTILSVLFSLCVLVAFVKNMDTWFEPAVLYPLIGFGISFFVAILMYLVTQMMANGVLDAKAAKKMVKSIIGSDVTRKIVGTVCTKLGITDQATVDRTYEKVKEKITACEYKGLTPDEILLISKAIGESMSVADGVHNPADVSNMGNRPGDWIS